MQILKFQYVWPSPRFTREMEFLSRKPTREKLSNPDSIHTIASWGCLNLTHVQ